MDESRLLKRKRKASGNNDQLVIACTDLANFYSSEGKFSQAADEYQIVAKIYKNESKLISYAQANRGIGEAYMGLLMFPNALKYFEIYHKVALEQNDELEQQRALAQLGHMYLTWYLETVNDDTVIEQKQKLNKAYGYFVQSLKKCESLTISKSEKQDMLARLFSNLGLVKENLGEYKKALTLFEKSIKICVEFDLYEQLYRGYMSLAALLDKHNQYNESIQNYNSAIETSKKLGTKKTELMCAALLGKSDVLIKLADFSGAKVVLHKAYKLKTPNKHEKTTIENNLRVVAAMSQVEDQLIVSSGDDSELKKLYEKMGDACCLLKNYSKAIKYYKKMLETAERTGASKKDLSECYYSLAETFKDNSQYDEAVEYFEKEYLLCKDNLTENLNTLSKIADTKEIAGAPVRDIKAIYERAFTNCRETQNVKEEKRMINRFRQYLKRVNGPHSDLNELEQRIKVLTDQNGSFGVEESTSSSESEDECQSEEMKARFGDDIRLSDITDLSSESETENVSPRLQAGVGKRKRQKTTRFSRNEKGEWPLHRACIKNEIKVIQHLIDSGHPINVRDHCGWLPLHEAASHGHTEAARILLDHGANINDRGGAQCDGITPLHDAASNGHLDLVELLLDKGASPLVKTHKGDTALDILKNWYSVNAPLEGDVESLYNSVVKRLSNALEKAGQHGEKLVKTSKITPEKENLYVRPSQQKVGKLRRTIDADDIVSDGLFSSFESSQQDSATDYQRTIHSLRHKSGNQINRSPISGASEKRSALISVVSDNDIVDTDNWLEDDLNMGARKKKRKLDDFCEAPSGTKTPFVRHRSSASSSREEVRTPSDSRDVEPITIDDFTLDDRSECAIERRLSNERPNSNVKRLSLSLKRPSTSPLKTSTTNNTFQRTKSSENISQKLKAPQGKLTQFGMTRIVVEADSTTTPALTQPVEQRVNQPQLFQSVSNNTNDPVLFVDVDIETKLYRVPVLMSQLQNKTIKWLAEEAASRYASKQYMKPTLELETTNGAALSDDDLVALLFPLAGTRAEQIIGKVVRWILPPLTEKYRDTCLHMSSELLEDLYQIAEETSATLDISDRAFLGRELAPFLKALSREELLTEINLSGNFLNTDCIKILCTTLATLSNITYLNLSCTGLQTGHVMHFANMFQDGVADNNLLRKLNKLDFSDNLLKDSCLRDLATVTQNLTLKELNLCNVGFTQHIFDSRQEVSLNLSELQCLNLSYNDLKTEDMLKFVSWLNLSKVTSLDVSKNNCRDLPKQLVEVFRNTQGVKLAMKHLNVSRCDVRDMDAYDLMSLLPELDSLDLSYNRNLTRILKSASNNLKINTLGCDNIDR